MYDGILFEVGALAWWIITKKSIEFSDNISFPIERGDQFNSFYDAVKTDYGCMGHTDQCNTEAVTKLSVAHRQNIARIKTAKLMETNFNSA
jgi:hypothetical protein